MKNLLILFLVFTSLGNYAQAVLVKDINLGNLSSSPSNKITFKNETYFVADDGIHGKELWKTDGTEAGTVLFKDILTGESSSFGAGFFDSGEFYGYVVENDLYFFALDISADYNLWKTDGTLAGTIKLKSFGSRYPGSSYFSSVNNNLVFTYRIDNVYSLWVSNGTIIGTTKIKDISTSQLIKKGEEILFSGYDSSDGELWKTDGTVAGTVLVKNIRATGSSNPKNFGVANGKLFFSANDGSSGDDLWVSDGTEIGTLKIKDFTSNSSTTKFNGVLNTYNNEAYLKVGNFDVWKTDGTEPGTVKVFSTTPYQMLSTDILNNKLIVFAYENYFWSSDGTEIGTERISTPNTKYSNWIATDSYQNTGNKIFFQGGTKGQLWSTDGTAIGTKPFVTINPIYTNEQGATKMANLNGSILFSIENQYGIGTELWISDGTELGTRLVKDINTVGNKSSNPSDLFSFNNELFFTTNDGVNGLELWKTDGTDSNTQLVKNINTNNFSSDPIAFVAYNSNFYFSAESREFGRELWKSDGTESGTFMLKDIQAGTKSGLYEASNMVVANDKLFFLADDGSTALELWSSDGTESGTHLVKNISGNFFSYVYLLNPELITYNNEVYFTSGNLDVGQELWKSDGTDVGTVLVKDIHSSASSVPKSFIVYNDLLFFKANDGENGEELWKSDGTEAGTVLVKDIYVGTKSGSINNLTISNNILYFVANDGVFGKELWKTDGTEVNTELVKDIDVGSRNGTPNYLTNHKGTLFFFANVAYGSGIGEFWKTDGTEVGTVMIKNIFPSGFGEKSLIVSTGNKLIFSGNTTFTNIEVWESDGTTEGTVALDAINTNIAFNSGSSHPKNFFVHNSQVYFTAEEDTFGRELYKLEVELLSTSSELESDIDKVTVFPNPSTRILNIKVENQQIKSVKIVSITGKEVFNLTKDVEIDYLNISHLASGVYLVMLKTDIGVFTKKIIKR